VLKTATSNSVVWPPKTIHTNCWVLFVHMILETWFLVTNTTPSQQQYNYILKQTPILIDLDDTDYRVWIRLSLFTTHVHWQVSSHGPTIEKPKMSKPCSPYDEHPFQPSAPQFPFLHDPPKNPSPKSKPSDMGPIREWTSLVIPSNSLVLGQGTPTFCSTVYKPLLPM
jgi:hypothetical protein